MWSLRCTLTFVDNEKQRRGKWSVWKRLMCTLTLALALVCVCVCTRGGGLQPLVVVYFAAARGRFEGRARSAINVVKVVYGHVADLRENGDRRG